MIQCCLDDFEFILKEQNPQEGLGMIKNCLGDLELNAKEQTILKKGSVRSKIIWTI